MIMYLCIFFIFLTVIIVPSHLVMSIELHTSHQYKVPLYSFNSSGLEFYYIT